MIGMIAIVILLLPFFLGTIVGMISSNQYPYNVVAAYPEDPVFESKEKLDSNSEVNETESNFQLSELQISEPSPDMNGAIDELLSAVEASNVSLQAKKASEDSGRTDANINESMTSNHFQAEDKLSFSIEKGSEVLESDPDYQTQDNALDEEVMASNECYEEKKDSSNQYHVNEGFGAAKQEEIDVFSDIPEIFMEQSDESRQDEGVGFDEDDLASFTSSEPACMNYAGIPDDGLNTKMESEHRSIRVITGGTITDTTATVFDQLPTPLSAKDYRAIQKRYGDMVAQIITTTPGIGGTITNDIMIGRLKKISIGYVLTYRDSYIVLDGEIPKHLLNSVILVYGRFVSQEHFYVYRWCDPEECSKLSIPPFTDSESEMAASSF